MAHPPHTLSLSLSLSCSLLTKHVRQPSVTGTNTQSHTYLLNHLQEHTLSHTHTHTHTHTFTHTPFHSISLSLSFCISFSLSFCLSLSLSLGARQWTDVSWSNQDGPTCLHKMECLAHLWKYSKWKRTRQQDVDFKQESLACQEMRGTDLTLGVNDMRTNGQTR